MATKPRFEPSALKLSAFTESHQQPGERVIRLNLDLMDEKPQVRTDRDDVLDRELAESIKNEKQLQAIVVRPSEVQGRFVIVFGHRRRRALGLLGETQGDVIVRNYTDAQARRAQIHENIQRENLKNLEIAKALSEDRAEMAKGGKNVSLEDLGKAYGKTGAWVSEHLQLLDMTAAAMQAFVGGVTADATVLNRVSRIERTAGEAEAMKVVETLRNNPETSARELTSTVLRKAKQEESTRKTAAKAAKKAAKKGGAGPAPARKAASPMEVAGKAYEMLVEKGQAPSTVLHLLGTDEEEILQSFLSDHYDEGKALRKEKNPRPIFVILEGLRAGKFGGDFAPALAFAAFSAGAQGADFNSKLILAAVGGK